MNAALRGRVQRLRRWRWGGRRGAACLPWLRGGRGGERFGPVEGVRWVRAQVVEFKEQSRSIGGETDRLPGLQIDGALDLIGHSGVSYETEVERKGGIEPRRAAQEEAGGGGELEAQEPIGCF